MSAASAQWSNRFEGKTLVVSSRSAVREQLLKTLGPVAVPAAEAAGGADALMKLEGNEFETMLLDPQIDDLDAAELVETIRGRFPRLHVVVMKKQDDADQMALDLANAPTANADEVSFRGKAECAGVETEIDVEAEADSDARETSFDDARECTRPRAREAAPWCDPLPGMIGNSRRMQKLYRLARLVAARDTAVLIVGATGTGKELVARGIHDVSRRSRAPFVVVNCAAIPESLLEAELFGFTRGAFTGAFQAKLGRIHAAHGGTLLLDEIGELPLSMQAKLLRFVQEGEVQRLGSADLFRVDARLIAATNVDLLQRVKEKQFREDLYYRLAVFPLEVPPLRQRTEDILPLAQNFLTSLCRQSGSPEKFLSPEAMNVLRRNAWPGNVRELQHWIERAFVLAESNQSIEPQDLEMPDQLN